MQDRRHQYSSLFAQLSDLYARLRESHGRITEAIRAPNAKIENLCVLAESEEQQIKKADEMMSARPEYTQKAKDLISDGRTCYKTIQDLKSAITTWENRIVGRACNLRACVVGADMTLYADGLIAPAERAPKKLKVSNPQPTSAFVLATGLTIARANAAGIGSIEHRLMGKTVSVLIALSQSVEDQAVMIQHAIVLSKLPDVFDGIMDEQLIVMTTTKINRLSKRIFGCDAPKELQNVFNETWYFLPNNDLLTSAIDPKADKSSFLGILTNLKLDDDPSMFQNMAHFLADEL